MQQSGRVFECGERDARARMEHDKTVVQEILNHQSFNCKKTDNRQQGSYMRDENQIILATVTIKYNNCCHPSFLPHKKEMLNVWMKEQEK